MRQQYHTLLQYHGYADGGNALCALHTTNWYVHANMYVCEYVCVRLAPFKPEKRW